MGTNNNPSIPASQPYPAVQKQKTNAKNSALCREPCVSIFALSDSNLFAYQLRSSADRRVNWPESRPKPLFLSHPDTLHIALRSYGTWESRRPQSSFLSPKRFCTCRSFEDLAKDPPILESRFQGKPSN